MPKTVAKKKCFVISTIGDEGTEEREIADDVFYGIIQPAFDDEFDVSRADLDKSPNMITERIVENIYDADLCVAEVSDKNANVYYELAFRHSSGKPVIQMKTHEAKLPFDNQNQGTVVYKRRLSGREQAIRDLQSAWEQVKKGVHNNVIQRTIKFRDLLKSVQHDKSPVEVQLLEVLRGLAERMDSIQAQLAHDARPSVITGTGFWDNNRAERSSSSWRPTEKALTLLSRDVLEEASLQGIPVGNVRVAMTSPTTMQLAIYGAAGAFYVTSVDWDWGVTVEGPSRQDVITKIVGIVKAELSRQSSTK